MSFDSAWIGYENIWFNKRASITASATATGYFPQSVGTWFLGDLWVAPDSNEQTIRVDCGAPTPVDYFGIAGHNLGSVSGILYYEGSDDPTFSTKDILVAFNASIPPFYDGEFLSDGESTYGDEVSSAAITNKVAAWKFTQVNYRYYRVRVSSASGQARIGALLSGRRMEFEIGFYGGMSPPDWNDEAEISNTRSQRGVFLGTSIARMGIRQNSIKLEPVTHAWVDDVWMPFKRHAQKYPWILAWKDDPINNRAYCHTVSFAKSVVLNKKHASVGVTYEGTSE